MPKARDSLKAELLAHYAKKEPCLFYQYDGFLEPATDDVVKADSEGDAVASGTTYDLMSGIYAVRVLVTAGTSEEDALRLLKKVGQVIRRDGFEWHEQEVARRDRELDRELCPRCGEDMDGPHHILCRNEDGTPTELSDEAVLVAVRLLRDRACGGVAF